MLEYFTNALGQISLSDEEEKKTSWVQLLRLGKWKHPDYGELEFTTKKLDQFVKNFDDNVRKIDLAIDAEHKPEDGACGWIKKLDNRGDEGLWALVEWTKRGVKLIGDKIYRYFSVEFDNEYKDAESGKKFKNVLFGAALTNRPFIKGMTPVNLSEYASALRDDPDIKGLISLAENVVKLTNGEKAMKKYKCGACGHTWESEADPKKCPECGSEDVSAAVEEKELTEQGETVEPKEKGEKADQSSERDDQAADKDAEEKKDNKGNVVAQGPKASDNKKGMLFKNPRTGEMFFVESEDEDDDEKKDDDEEKEEGKELKAGKKKGKASLEEDDEEEDDKEKDDEEDLSEGVMVATKKLSQHETETLRALSETKGPARKVLKENLKFLRDSRAENEKMQIETMLRKHFLAGKMAPNEMEMWKTLLFAEATQVDVAVFKLNETKDGKQKTGYKSLSYIVDHLLSQRPVIVELRELAKRGGTGKTAEDTRLSEDAAIAARIAKKTTGTARSLKEKDG